MMTNPNQVRPKKEIFEVKRSRDPVSGAMGVSGGYDLAAQAQKTVLHYKGRGGEFFLTADVYKLEGQPLYLILFCPLCQNTLRVSQDNKAIDFDPERTPRFAGYRNEEVLAQLDTTSLGGSLSIEPFGCTWEADPELRRQHFAVCPWKVVVENNRVRDV